MSKHSLPKVKRQTAGVKRPRKRANGSQSPSVSASDVLLTQNEEPARGRLFSEKQPNFHYCP